MHLLPRLRVSGFKLAFGSFLVAFILCAQPAAANPTDISLSRTSIYQTAVVNGVVGTLTTVDANNVPHTYTLVAGTGDTDNASFNIFGSSLRANNAGALSAGSYSVRVQTDDGSSGTFEKAFPSPSPMAFSFGAGLAIIGCGRYPKTGLETSLQKQAPRLFSLSVV